MVENTLVVRLWGSSGLTISSCCPGILCAWRDQALYDNHSSGWEPCVTHGACVTALGGVAQEKALQEPSHGTAYPSLSWLPQPRTF